MDESEMIVLRITMPRAGMDALEEACRRDGLPLDELLADALARAAFGLRCDVLHCVTNAAR
jgi:hypothetical protein